MPFSSVVLHWLPLLIWSIFKSPTLSYPYAFPVQGTTATCLFSYGRPIIFPTRQWICATRDIFVCVCKPTWLRRLSEIQTRLNSSFFRCPHKNLQASSLTFWKQFLLYMLTCSSVSFQLLFMLPYLLNFFSHSFSFLLPLIHLCLKLCWLL